MLPPPCHPHPPCLLLTPLRPAAAAPQMRAAAFPTRLSFCLDKRGVSVAPADLRLALGYTGRWIPRGVTSKKGLLARASDSARASFVVRVTLQVAVHRRHLALLKRGVASLLGASLPSTPKATAKALLRASHKVAKATVSAGAYDVRLQRVVQMFRKPTPAPTPRPPHTASPTPPPSPLPKGMTRAQAARKAEKALAAAEWAADVRVAKAKKAAQQRADDAFVQLHVRLLVAAHGQRQWEQLAAMLGKATLRTRLAFALDKAGVEVLARPPYDGVQLLRGWDDKARGWVRADEPATAGAAEAGAGAAEAAQDGEGGKGGALAAAASTTFSGTLSPLRFTAGYRELQKLHAKAASGASRRRRVVATTAAPAAPPSAGAGAVPPERNEGDWRHHVSGLRSRLAALEERERAEADLIAAALRKNPEVHEAEAAAAKDVRQDERGLRLLVARAQRGDKGALGELVGVAAAAAAALLLLLRLAWSCCCCCCSGGARDDEREEEGAAEAFDDEKGGIAMSEKRGILSAAATPAAQLRSAASAHLRQQGGAQAPAPVPAPAGFGSMGDDYEEELAVPGGIGGGGGGLYGAHGSSFGVGDDLEEEGGFAMPGGARAADVAAHAAAMDSAASASAAAQAYAAQAEREAAAQAAAAAAERERAAAEVARQRQRQREEAAASKAAQARARATVVSVLEEHEDDEEAAQWL